MKYGSALDFQKLDTYDLVYIKVHLSSLDFPMASWIKPHDRGSILLLYIQPGASQNSVSGEHDGRLKIKIKAPPRDGEANKGLIQFLSEVLKIPKSKISLIQGESSRQKNLLIELPPDKIVTLISE